MAIKPLIHGGALIFRLMVVGAGAGGLKAVGGGGNI